jgi:hypothetical protein
MWVSVESTHVAGGSRKRRHKFVTAETCGGWFASVVAASVRAHACRALRNASTDQHLSSVECLHMSSVGRYCRDMSADVPTSSISHKALVYTQKLLGISVA